MILSLGGGRGLGDDIDDLIAANSFDDSGPVTVSPLYSSPAGTSTPAIATASGGNGTPVVTTTPVVSSSGDGFWTTLGKSLLGTGLATTGVVVANQLGGRTPQQQAAILAAQQAQAAAAQRQMLTIGGIIVAVIVGGALLMRRSSPA